MKNLKLLSLLVSMGLCAAPAPAMAWSSGAVAPGVPVRLEHFTELMSAIDSKVAACQVSPSPTPFATPTRGGLILAATITAMRDRVKLLYPSASPYVPSPDPTIVRGVTPIRAAHIADLRNAVAGAPCAGSPSATPSPSPSPCYEFFSMALGGMGNLSPTNFSYTYVYTNLAACQHDQDFLGCTTGQTLVGTCSGIACPATGPIYSAPTLPNTVTNHLSCGNFVSGTPNTTVCNAGTAPPNTPACSSSLYQTLGAVCFLGGCCGTAATGYLICQ